MAVSKRDLKPPVTFFRKFACDLGFAGYVSVDVCPPEGDFRHGALRRNIKNTLKHTLTH